MKYIKEHSLSVGYNPSFGQSFFDLLKSYEPWIHSYYFSLTKSMNGEPYPYPAQILSTLNNCNQYDIPANLLLNATSDMNTPWFQLIDYARERTRLTAVTVIHPEMARIIKQQYPKLEIHLSVRYWDFNYRPCNILMQEEIIDQGYYKYIDVINLSGAKSYNDKLLRYMISSLRIRTKFIVNEGCIINRHDNYKNFPGYENDVCMGKCKRICDRVVADYPWMGLSRISLYKEQAPLYNYDILKISSRNISLDALTQLLSYWTSDEPTRYVQLGLDGSIMDISKNYEAFLGYINTRCQYCTGDCNMCRKCEKLYNDIVNIS